MKIAKSDSGDLQNTAKSSLGFDLSSFDQPTIPHGGEFGLILAFLLNLKHSV